MGSRPGGDRQVGTRDEGVSRAAGLTGFTLVVHVEVFGSAGAGVRPKQQVVDGQLAVPVALTLRQQLLHSGHAFHCTLETSSEFA